MSRERRDLIAASAPHRLVSAKRAVSSAASGAPRKWRRRDPRVFLPAQFSNAANPAAHEARTGPEILEQLALSGRAPDAFVAGVGTGGTVMGVGRCLRARNPAVRITRWSPPNRRRCPRAQDGTAPDPGDLGRVHPAGRQARRAGRDRRGVRRRRDPDGADAGARTGPRGRHLVRRQSRGRARNPGRMARAPSS